MENRWYRWFLGTFCLQLQWIFCVSKKAKAQATKVSLNRKQYHEKRGKTLFCLVKKEKVTSFCEE